MLEIIELVVDDSPMDVLVATPEGSGRHPGVLLSHYKHGLESFTRRNARYLASEGFVVVAPNHFHHTPGEPDVVKRTKALRDVRLINDMHATTDYLRSHPRVIPEATAIMGHQARA